MAAANTAPAFTKGGAKAAAPAKLDKAVFAVMPENHELLKLAYHAYLANGRESLATAKTRDQVRGGGKKPWRQKGTGRARVGSTRNPIWRGGGVVFGPTGEENYKVKVNVRAKRLALRQALSLAASEGRIRVVESFEVKDGKTAQAAELLGKVDASGNVLLVLESREDMVERSIRNLTNVKLVRANYLTVFDIMNADTLVVSEKALAMVNEWLGGNK